MRSVLSRAALATAGAGLAAGVLATAAPAAPTAPAGQTVAPGTLVRWSAEDTELCILEGEGFLPLGDTCYYAVDLLREPGPLALSRVRQGRREEAVLRVSDYPYPVQQIRLDDDGQVHLSAADLARHQREQREVEALWGRHGAARFELPLGAPLARLPAGGRFGARRVFNGEPRSPHGGADYAAAAGTPVLATADGRVALAGDHFFAGKSLYLDHGDGLISMYFHLSSIGVDEGQTVRRGQPIGAVGATGRATGPHLHFALRWRGARIDPALLLADPRRIPQVGGL